MLTNNQTKYIFYLILILLIVLITISIYIIFTNCESFNNKSLSSWRITYTKPIFNEYFNNKSLKNRYYSMKSGKKEKSLISKIYKYQNLY
jgi:hypothetical protein